VGEDGTGAMWIAPELLEFTRPTVNSGCTGEIVMQVSDLASAGRSNFDWNPVTGELSFDAQRVMQQVTLPEDWLPEESERPALPTQSCGSR